MTNLSETDHYRHMQQAVNIVNTSPHPVSKIAATLAGTDKNGKAFTLSHTNYWPAPIETKLGKDTRIGGSSGTIHAETACILASPQTAGANLYVTDPFCPNCAKNMADAGITDIYVDHKGFDKEWLERRGDHFSSLSLQICEEAGISVYKIHRKAQKIETLYKAAENFTDHPGSALETEMIDTITPALFKDFVTRSLSKSADQRFVLACGYDNQGRDILIKTVMGSITDEADDHFHAEDISEKYKPVQEPLNRLIMRARRDGITINPDYIFSAKIPTAREQINFIGAGFDTLYLGDGDAGRGPKACEAFKLLRKEKLIKFLDVQN